jgi:uncharacterized phage-associated protein
MITVFDVAAFILTQLGPTPAMKLQKLVYYSQAWSLVWDEEPLFEEKIYAWINGPVVPELYEVNKGKFKVAVDEIPGNPEALNETQQETVSIIVKDYGAKSSQWLSDLTHLEDPWRNARKGLDSKERGHQEITWAAMAEYYESLSPNEGE